MSRTLLSSMPLRSLLWPREHRIIKQLLLVLGAALLLSIAAQISIPLQPVPLTFQSVTVLLIGMALGARLGTAAILSYLAMGCIGLPVFADFMAGPAVMIGPTAGYLIGFVPAALISGYLTQQGWAKSYIMTLVAAVLGTCIIFACGTTILAQFTGWPQAYLLGVKPFIISEPLKLLALMIIIPRLWQASSVDE